MAHITETIPLVPPPSLEHDESLIELMGPDDPLNPRNSMPPWRKWLSVVLLGARTFAATFSSSVFVAVGPAVARELNSSSQQITLATTLFIFGFAAGPVIMGPASEVYGRKFPLFVGYLAFVLCQIPVARAHDIHTILLWRFIGAVASSSSPSIVGGCLADLWPVERGVSVAIFAATTLIGPPVGAIVGSALVQSPVLGWRWAAWLSLIIGAVLGLAGYIMLPETYVPVLWQRKAQQLRIETRDWALHTNADETPVTLGNFSSKYLTRPFAMLVREPILVLMTLYVSFTFGMMYFLFVAYNFSFVRERGVSSLDGSLPLLAVVAGIIVGSIYVTHYTLTTYSHKFNNGKRASPEDRIPPMMIGGAILPVGLLWFAATCSPQSQILFSLLAYVLDIYSINANSAVSGTVIVRSLLGGMFPLVVVPMYENLGAQRATSIVGLVACCFFPVPVVLYVYGERIRSWSKYVPRS